MRQVDRADWTSSNDELAFTIEADAFLKHMVRRLVAASLDVGMGRIPARTVTDLLGHPGSRWEGRLADPHGLSLVAVTYDGRAAPVSDDDD